MHAFVDPEYAHCLAERDIMTRQFPLFEGHSMWVGVPEQQLSPSVLDNSNPSEVERLREIDAALSHTQDPLPHFH